VARRMTLVGSAIELAATAAMERRLGELGEPLRTGTAGRLAKAARRLVVAGATTVALGGRRSRVAAALGGAAVLAGSAFERFAIFQAGFASAADPKYVVGGQRQRLDGQRQRLDGHRQR